MPDDDYEIVSEKEIDNMKSEIQKLRKSNPKGALDSSFDSLQNSIDRMNEILLAATQSMRDEPEIHQLMEKLDSIIDQNEKIAKGMVAIIDMMNEMKASPQPEEQTPFVPRRQEPMFNPIPPAQINSMQPQMPNFPPPRTGFNPGPLPPPEFPPSFMPEGPEPLDLGPVPPPMPEQKKKGLFGKFKR